MTVNIIPDAATHDLVRQTIRGAKQTGEVIEAVDCQLRAVSIKDLDTDLTRFLTDWRAANLLPFMKIFQVTAAGTRLWLEGLLVDEDRILFVIEHNGTPVGHVGLADFGRGFEICDVIRGEKTSGNVMADALLALMAWARSAGVGDMQLEVVNDAIPAIGLYHRLGFVPVELVPLTEIKDGDETIWVETEDVNAQWSRFLIRMVQRLDAGPEK